MVGDPVQTAFNLYRERHGLLSPDEIREIGKGYRLSQRSFATLLGMSESLRLNRYGRGSVQEATHDNTIRACRNAGYVHDLLARRGHLLPAAHRQRLESALSAGHTHRIAAELRNLFTLAMMNLPLLDSAVSVTSVTQPWSSGSADGYLASLPLS